MRCRCHRYALKGAWTFEYEYVKSSEAGAQLKLHFFARDVFLVMDSEQAGKVSVEMLSPDAENLSLDLDLYGAVTVDEARLYHLVSLDEAQDGEVLLTFEGAGIEAFAFTFGS